MNIVCIGSGQVATHLVQAIKQSGQTILQVYSRNLTHAQTLADKVNAQAINQFSQITPNADLYIIAVKDDAIETVLQSLNVKDKCVVHTSGTISSAVISKYFKQAGVFYPLQTFSKNKVVSFKNIPICITASYPAVAEKLQQLAQKLSDKVYLIDDEKRQALHVAAVFACNFPNHLYAIANQILVQNQLDFEMIRPLIAETTDKVMLNLPHTVQTGPASRADEITLNKHLNLLAKLPAIQNICQILSDSIKLTLK